MANVQGETKCLVEPLLVQHGRALCCDELCSCVSVVDHMVTLLEISYVLLVYLLVVCFNAHAMVVMLNVVKAEFVVSHVWLLEDLEHLDRTHVLKRKFSSSFKSLDSPQV